MNGVNYKGLMKYHAEIIDGIRIIFIEMSEGVIFNDDINVIENKHKILLKEMNETYHYMRSLSVTDDVIYEIVVRIRKIMILWRNLKLLVTSLTYLLGEYFISQMNDLDDELAYKTEDHIEKNQENDIRILRRF